MSVERLVKGGICHCSEVSFRDCGGTFVVCLSTQTAICGPEVSRSDSGAVSHLQMSALLHPVVERYRENRKVGHDDPGQRDFPAPRESDCGTLESADAAKQEKSRMRSGRRSSAST